VAVIHEDRRITYRPTRRGTGHQPDPELLLLRAAGGLAGQAAL